MPQARSSSRDESLMSLLGGRRAGIEATLPAVGFVLGWLVSGQSIGWGVGAALGTAVVIAGIGLRRGRRPRAVLLGLLGVVVAALIVLRTGRAADFFLVQVVANMASALAWAGSIVVRWPLLGVVVGGVLGQRTRWRRDPDLVRAYGRASWVWVASYVLRVAVFTPLWLAGEVVALGVTRVVLSWPLVAAVLAVSWVVLRRSLPDDHPGLRQPALPDDPADASSPDRDDAATDQPTASAPNEGVDLPSDDREPTSAGNTREPRERAG